jgi:hypothetical protein
MSSFSDFSIAGVSLSIEFHVRGDVGAYPSAVAPWPMADVEMDGATGAYRFRRSDLEGQLQGERARFVCGRSPSSQETCARLVASVVLPRFGSLLMHASAAVVAGETQGRARVFSGPSGAGKSTLVGLVGGRSMGDELVAIRLVQDQVVAYSTPFAGTRAPVEPHSAPVEGIYFIAERTAATAASPTNRAVRLARPAAVARLLRNTVTYARGVQDVGACLDVADAIAARVPIWQLAFAPTPQVVTYLHGLGDASDAV